MNISSKTEKVYCTQYIFGTVDCDECSYIDRSKETVKNQNEISCYVVHFDIYMH